MLHFRWVSCCLPLKRWRVKEQLALKMPKNLEGCHHYFLTESWEIILWSCIFSPQQSYILCCQTSRKNSSWPALLHRWEKKNLFGRSQAGFRKGRSCEDQITQIVQAREDSFQQPPMQSSVLTLLDISKAYDTVWRKKLLLNMLDAGIPSTFIRWLSSFFNDHRARVQLFNVFGSRCRFNQDLAFYYFCYWFI